MLKKTTDFIKKEPVLIVSGVLALASVCLVPVSEKYIGYIDFRSLTLLFVLMLDVGAMRRMGLFRAAGSFLLKKCRSERQICAVLILLPFFTSMFITNDVALITFVPFAVELLMSCGGRRRVTLVVVLQTVAANTGSMLTPMGNPQNLYLYSLSQFGFWEFIKILLPYWGLALFLLLISLLIFDRHPENRDKNVLNKHSESKTAVKPSALRLAAVGVLFLLCLAAVAHIIDWRAAAAITAAAMLAVDYKAFRSVDWSLLATFVFFFVFVGNIGNIPAIRDFLSSAVSKSTVLVSAASSQLISNVPAAVLLSGFTKDYAGLIIGTDIGGLGTLIASMASLISFRYCALGLKNDRVIYLAVFTAVNLVFLLLLCGMYLIIG